MPTASNILGPIAPLPSLAERPPRFIVEMEWTVNPTGVGGGTDLWTPVTHLVKRWSIRRGRVGRLGKVETGRCEIVLDNTDRRFEVGYTGELVNNVENPSLEMFPPDLSGWTAVGTPEGPIAGSGAATPYVGGSRTVSIRQPTGSFAVGDGIELKKNNGSRFPVSAQSVWTFSVYTKSGGSTPNTALGRCQILEYNAAGTLIQTTSGAIHDFPAGPPFGVWYRRFVTVTTQPTTATVALRWLVSTAGTGQTNEAIVFDAAQLENGPLSAYCDGEQDNCRWQGARHLSSSSRGGPYHGNLRPMRRLRITSLSGNLLRDSSFDTPPGSNLTDLDDPDENNVWVRYNAATGTLTRVGSPVHSPGFSYQATGYSAGHTIAFRQRYRWRIPIQSTDQLTLSCYLQKSGAGNPKSTFILWLYDEGMISGTGFGLAAFNPPIGSWQRYSKTVTIAPGAGYKWAVADFTLVDTTADTGVTVWIDDVQLEFGPAPSDYVNTRAGVSERFRGYMQNFPQESPSYRRGETTIVAVDGFAALANGEYSGDPPSEGTTERITRMLDDANWPIGLRRLDAGTKTLAAITDLVDDHLSHIVQVGEAELGLIFVDGFGRLVFHDANHRSTDPRSTVSQFLFGDAAGELPYLPSILPDYDLAKIINEAKATRAGGTEQVASDTDSKNRYFTRTRSYQSLLSTDAAVLTFAQAIVSKYKEPQMEPAELSFEPARAPGLWDVAMRIELSDRITVKRRPQGALTSPRTFECFVEGIQEAADLDPRSFKWVTTLNLSLV